MTGIVILAAGKGSRLNTTVPKALVPLAGFPLLEHLLAKIPADLPIYVIISPQDEAIFKQQFPKLQYLFQHQPNGTGDALKQNIDSLSGHSSLIILNGDTPLIDPLLIPSLIQNTSENILVTFTSEDTKAYGQVLINNSQCISIVEAKDRGNQSISNICYSGVMKLSQKYLRELKHIKPSSVTGEYYLTDLITKQTPFSYIESCQQSLQGINTPSELRQAHRILLSQQFHRLFNLGIHCVDSDSLVLSPRAMIGSGSQIARNVAILGDSTIGQNCQIGQGAVIKNSYIGDNTIIHPYSVIDHCKVGTHNQIGPFSHTQQTTMKNRSAVGNFVEIKRSTIGSGVKAKHLSYLGDSYIDDHANIGAGVITCNYTPWHSEKGKSFIGKNAFIGAGSILVAPSIIGEYAVCAAGSVITALIQPFSLGISRSKLTIKPNWAYHKLNYAAAAAKKLSL